MVLHGLGKRIREERIRVGLTQEKLAEAVGCNESYIGQIERSTKNPSLEIVVNIASALRVTVDYLLAESVNIENTDPLIEELTDLLRGRSPEDIRYIVNINRLLLDLIDKKMNH